MKCVDEQRLCTPWKEQRGSNKQARAPHNTVHNVHNGHLV
jgi:hypothetical protein